METMRSARVVFLAASLFAAVIGHGPRIQSAAVAEQAGNAEAQSRAGAANTARHVDRTQLMRDVTTLASPSLEGRGTGTAGGVKAREWIVQQFASTGLMPATGADFVQPFMFSTREVRAILPGGRPYRTDYPAANVVGRVAGRDADLPAIVITAHYDHVGIRSGVVYPGADDNASGVAALLAAARRLTTAPPRHSMVLAALDAEEIGQYGAKALLASGVLPRGKVALNVNLDMVSRNDANEIYAAGTYYTAWLTPILRDVQARASVKVLFGHDRPARLGGGLEDWTHSSDHGPCHEAGVPFVYFGVEDHADYHKPTDTADRIDPRFFGDAVDMIVDAILTFDARLN
jgi:hypothetical protein